MLILGAKSDTGNAVHAVLGPESELTLDIHGAVTVDIAELVKAMGADKPLCLTVTRCRNEAATAAEMDIRGIPYIGTSQKAGQPCDKPAPELPDQPPGPDIGAILRYRMPESKEST